MRGYHRDELEDYDDYEDEEEEEEEEEEYEEEEDPKPTKEELEYLELRQRLKEAIRKQMKKENGSSLSNRQEAKNKPPNDNFGSFFGPAKPVIAQRVIQESKSLLENQQLAARLSNSHHGKKKSSPSATAGSKAGVRNQLPKVRNELQVKVQKLKDTRDYSFLLSDNAEPPAPARESSVRNWPTPSSEARSTQVPLKSKQPLGSGGRHVNGGHEPRKPVNGHMHSKIGSTKLASASKPNSASMDSRKQLGSKNGVGTGRPLGPKALHSKMPVASSEKRASAPGSNNPSLHKQPSSKLQSSVPKQQLLELRKQQLLEQRKQQHPEQRKQQHLEQRREKQELNRSRMMPKQPVTSTKPQISKPLKPNPSHNMQDQRPKKKPVRHFSDEDECGDAIAAHTMQYQRPKKKPSRPFSDDEDVDEDPFAAIRKMFGYNPKKYAGRDDDDSDMEANFDDILKEERRSAKIARKEDEEQLRLIEEEERREREMLLRKKKRKLGQQ